MNAELPRLLIFSLSLLSAIAVFNNWGDIKPILSHINHWVRNEDGEHLTAYGIMCFALVVFVVWGLSLL